MIEIVWEMIVRPDAQGQFELVFGRGGAWGKLFGDSPGFRGTTVLNDTDQPNRYLIIDVWDTKDEQERAWRDRADGYARLEADLEGWTESRVEVGTFRVRAEATVRARSKTSRRDRRSAR